MLRRTSVWRIAAVIAAAPFLMADNCCGRAGGFGLPINSTGASWLAGDRIVLLRDGGDTSLSPQLYVMGADGIGVMRLADSLSHVRSATPSPDGSRIAFVANDGDLYVIEVLQRRLTHLGSGQAPVWSPDGRSLAFIRSQLVAGSKNDYVFITDTFGTHVTRIGIGDEFSWAPDSRNVAMVARGEWTDTIRIVSTAGAGARTLVAVMGKAGLPTWSPDGRRIAFVRQRHGVSAVVHVVDVRSRATRVFGVPGEPLSAPAWSPASRQLVVAGALDSTGIAYLISLDRDSAVRLDRIPERPSQLANPVWSPAGGRIALVARKLPSFSCENIHEDALALRVASLDGSGTREVASLCHGEGDVQWSHDGRRILFSGGCDGGDELYLADASGREVKRLTWGAWMNLTPTWRSDRDIAFTRVDRGASSVTMTSMNGEPAERLFSGSDASWTTDGAHVVYVGEVHQDKKEWSTLYVADGDGSNARMLVAPVLFGDSLEPARPRWSPDGARIVFAGNSTKANTKMGIYVVDVARGDVRRLNADSTEADAPAWSPDGRRIVYAGPLPGSSPTDPSRIMVIDADGSDATVLNSSQWATQPAWSPDGRRIAFAGFDASGLFDIYVMNADGSSVRRLTSDAAADFSPAWSPDGKWIAFVSERDGNANIFVVPSDGGWERRLTSAPRSASQGRVDRAR